MITTVPAGQLAAHLESTKTSRFTGEPMRESRGEGILAERRRTQPIKISANPCSWCFPGVRFPEGTSHGICDKHAAEMRKELK